MAAMTSSHWKPEYAAVALGSLGGISVDQNHLLASLLNFPKTGGMWTLVHGT